MRAVTSRAALVATALVALSACSSKKERAKDPPSDPVTPAKRACPPEAPYALDVPARHEAWAATLDIPALKAAVDHAHASVGKLPDPLRRALLDANDALNAADRAVTRSQDTVHQACDKLVEAARGNEGVTGILGCWSYATDRVQRLEDLDAAVQRAHVQALTAAWDELTRAITDRQTREAELAKAADAMGASVGKVADAIHASAADRSTLVAAFEKLPTISIAVGQLSFIGEHQRFVEKNTDARGADIACATLALVGPPARAGSGQEPDAATQIDWQQRLDAIHRAIDKMLAVPGTEH